jgi:hypothetical protein
MSIIVTHTSCWGRYGSYFPVLGCSQYYATTAIGWHRIARQEGEVISRQMAAELAARSRLAELEARWDLARGDASRGETWSHQRISGHRRAVQRARAALAALGLEAPAE